MQFICFNNTFIQKGELSFYDVERFRVADACFESILVHRGDIPLLKYHQARLNQACETFGFDSYTIDVSELKALIQKNNLEERYIKIRISLVRAKGKNYSPHGNQRHSLIECESLDSIFNSIKQLGLFKSIQKAIDSIGKVKHSNALLYVLAKQYALENDLDDVLIQNNNGFFIEASSSNLFILKDGEIYTPKSESACVLGVSREFMLNFLDVKKVDVNESLISSADEIFLTNAIQIIQPVENFKGKALKTEQTEKIIKTVKTKLAI